MDDWLDQLTADIESQASSRSDILESLFRTGDFEAIRDWLDEWEKEDNQPDSLRLRYNKVILLNRLKRFPISAANLNSPALIVPNQPIKRK
jgi:hypothetical protein